MDCSFEWADQWMFACRCKQKALKLKKKQNKQFCVMVWTSGHWCDIFYCIILVSLTAEHKANMAVDLLVIHAKFVCAASSSSSSSQACFSESFNTQSGVSFSPWEDSSGTYSLVTVCVNVIYRKLSHKNSLKKSLHHPNYGFHLHVYYPPVV